MNDFIGSIVHKFSELPRYHRIAIIVAGLSLIAALAMIGCDEGCVGLNQ